MIFASGAQAAGHVQVGDWAILGGMTGVHQFVHIGAHSFCGGGSIVLKDVPPYLMVHGAPCVPAGINTEGLKRRGFSSEALLEIRRAYKEVYRKGQTVPEALQALADKATAMPEVKAFTDFIANASRGIVR
ncbi:acyl-[acyl-carrier-protein]--UDP-N-acetylglucosamine O-acyltransferase [Alishewanella longhuensis]